MALTMYVTYQQKVSGFIVKSLQTDVDWDDDDKEYSTKWNMKLISPKLWQIRINPSINVFNGCQFRDI